MKIWVEYPQDGKLRSRKVVSRSNAISTGKFPSWKMQRMMQYESKHELKAFMLLDACPAVVSFSEQPCVIHYEMDGTSHRHYPDILVKTAPVAELWEVKERADATLSDVMRRTDLLMQAMPALGFTYRLVLAETLAKEPLLGNIRQLLKFGHRQVPPVERERIRQALLRAGGISWEAFKADSRYSVSRLILEGFLDIDLDTSLAQESIVRLSSRKKETHIWESLLM